MSVFTILPKTGFEKHKWGLVQAYTQICHATTLKLIIPTILILIYLKGFRNNGLKYVLRCIKKSIINSY